MARNSRNILMSNFYHIMVQGDEKKYVFETVDSKKKYIYLLKRNAFRNDVKIIAYCVMDNHVHILLHSSEIERISKMMSQCNTTFGLYYSKKRGNIGHVFRGRYKSEAIQTKNYLLNCIKYIHDNPVEADKVTKCAEYLYSSYLEYLNRNGIFDDILVSLCEMSPKDYDDIIYSNAINYEYIDNEHDKECIKDVVEELKVRYDFDNMNYQQIYETYVELKKRCRISKAELSRILKIERKKLSRILKRQALVLGKG